MNKIIFLFTFLFLVASCAEMNYKHAVKRSLVSYHTSGKKEKSIDSDSKREMLERTVSETSIAEISVDETMNQPLEIETPSVPEKSTEPEIVLEDQSTIQLAVKTRVFENDEDSTKAVSPEKITQALKAEDLGIKSRNLGIVGFILQFTFLFSFVGLVLSIIGLSKGIKSLRADYNTPKGVTNAKIGVVFSSITVGFYVLIISLFLILLISFLF